MAQWSNRGYQRGNGKGAAAPYKKGEPLFTLEQVRGCKSYGEVLAEDVVLIDIDDTEQADILFQIVKDKDIHCRVYNTSRGKHFLFKNTRGYVKSQFANKKTAINITADGKPGIKNTYHALKVDGKERELVLDTDTPDEIPIWLKVCPSSVDFLHMKEGDGRDSALHGYILNLGRAGLNNDEIIDTINIINDYIMDDPLSDLDIDRITRDDQMPKQQFLVDGKFAHHLFAEHMALKLNMKYVNNALSLYKDGIYTADIRELEAAMVQEIPDLKDRQIQEAVKRIKLLPLEKHSVDKKLVAFRNGILNIDTMTMTGFSPEYVIVNKVPWDYNPKAYDAMVDLTLNKLAVNDPEIRANLEECIGYCFFGRNEMANAIMLTGDGANGKSTFIDCLRFVLGDENWSCLDIDELGERFSVASLLGKMANLGDDVPAGVLDDKATARFKKISSGNPIKAEMKGKDAFTFVPTAKLVFSINGVLRFKNATAAAVARRWINIPFRAVFKKTDPDYDPYLKDKLLTQSGAEYMIRIGIEGLKRIIENRQFSDSKVINKLNDEIYKTNDNFRAWVDEEEIKVDQIVKKSRQDVYARYELWCTENGLGAIGSRIFANRICLEFKLDVKRIRIGPKLIYGYYDPAE